GWKEEVKTMCTHRQPTIAPGKHPTEDTHFEAVLIQRCLAGHAAAWDTLIRRYEKQVYKFAYALCRHPEDAEDITGQVFLRLYQNLRTFRHKANFSSWLF